MVLWNMGYSPGGEAMKLFLLEEKKKRRRKKTNKQTI
jgi:hypothetical protein